MVKPITRADILRTIAAYEQTGRCAQFYPRAPYISVDGRTMRVPDAMAKMKAVLTASK